MSRLTIGLAIIATGLLLLLVNSASGKTLGLANDDFARIISFTAIAAVMAAGLVGNRHRLRPAMTMLLIWLVIILSLASVYVFKAELLTFAGRMSSGLLPGSILTSTSKNGQTVVTVSKNVQGHFTAMARLNGHDITMLVDTGATDVALSYEDAESIGLNPDSLDFTRPINTANGRTFAAPVLLDSIQIGPIIRNSIHASVAMKGQLDQSLLGMSFLSTLSSVEMGPDQMRLTD